MSVSERFVIPGQIVTKARPRASVIGGHARMYTPKTTAYYENLVKLTYKQHCKTNFGTSPLGVNIVAYFNPSKESAKYINYGLKCVVHKDLDNIAKTILDALNGIAYKDDKQVCELYVRKEYSQTNEEYVEVNIYATSGSIEEAKYNYQLQQLELKYYELKNKPKLSKKEKEKLERMEKILSSSKC